jgi:hypothetical protein
MIRHDGDDDDDHLDFDVARKYRAVHMTKCDSSNATVVFPVITSLRLQYSSTEKK